VPGTSCRVPGCAKNYFTIAPQNLVKTKSYSFINIGGQRKFNAILLRGQGIFKDMNQYRGRGSRNVHMEEDTWQPVGLERPQSGKEPLFAFKLSALSFFSTKATSTRGASTGNNSSDMNKPFTI
jgi:hypothetical protein